jgi:ADP-ribose pyrophosphatase YjhB (NUDIX family)
VRRIDDKQGRGLAGRPTPSPWGDLGLWALSLATAVGLWFFVNTGDGTEDRVMRVRIEPTNVPAGLVLSGTVTEYAELRVRGPSVIVAGIDQRRIRGEVDLSDAQPPRFREALTEKNFVLPRKVEVRKIAPPVAVFELDRLATRTLPVRLERRGEPPPGQIVGGVEIVPDHVEVVGPAEALAALRDVVTKPLDLATLGEGAQVDLDLDSAGALVRITPERVLVRVDLETTSADRRFPGVRVSLGGDGAWRATPSEVTLVLRGAPERLDALALPGGSVYVDTAGRPVPGSFRSRPSVRLPQGVELVRIDPGEVLVQSATRGAAGKAEGRQ